jgi:hypothetical protein
MSDDKRSPGRVGKPLVYGEVIIGSETYARNILAADEGGFARGYAEALEAAEKAAQRLCEKLSGIDAKAACELVAEDIRKLASSGWR